MSEELPFSPNLDIDAAIRQMMPFFNEISQSRISKKIRDVAKAAASQKDENSDAEARHVFRELIPAYVLNSLGFSFEYEYPIENKTPDWLDDNSKILLESYSYERDGRLTFPDRVISNVIAKCEKYEDIATKHSLRMTVAVYLDFLSDGQLHKCDRYCDRLDSLFVRFPHLFCILFFAEDTEGLVNSDIFVIGTQSYGFKWYL